MRFVIQGLKYDTDKMKDKEKQAWYYTSMIDLLKDLNETPEYQEYVRLCGKVFGGIAGCCSLQNI